MPQRIYEPYELNLILTVIQTSLNKFEPIWTSVNQFGQIWTSLNIFE